MLGACASLPSSGPSKWSTTFAARPDEPFAIDGRLSARRGSDGVSVAFAWTHDRARDELVITNPLGQTIAELASDASARRIEVRTADGRREESADWASLTERVVGFPLPVESLAFWAQGTPRAATAYQVETDASGRASTLLQDGCQIVYAYADASTPQPSRLSLSCHDVELRIVIDRWRAA